MSIDRPFGIEEIEWRIGTGQSEVGVIEGANRPDIFPKPFKIIAVDLMGFNGSRDHLASEIIEGTAFQEFTQGINVEQVDAGGGQKGFFFVIAADKCLLNFRVPRFFKEIGNAHRRVAFQDSKTGGILRRTR